MRFLAIKPIRRGELLGLGEDGMLRPYRPIRLVEVVTTPYWGTAWTLPIWTARQTPVGVAVGDAEKEDGVELVTKGWFMATTEPRIGG